MRASVRDFYIDNLLVRIHFIIVMIRWTGLAPWECEFPFPGSVITGHQLARIFGRGRDFSTQIENPRTQFRFARFPWSRLQG